MFADDCVLLSETAEGLQLHLNQLEDYCDRWCLTVNIEKTKIVVFRKGGQIGKNSKWIFKRNEIDVVESFNYLGFVLSSGGSFRKGIDTIGGKSLNPCSL
jgi:hypothetical protein